MKVLLIGHGIQVLKLRPRLIDKIVNFGSASF